MSGESAAYGLRLRGLEPTPWLAVEGASHWPLVTVVRAAGAPADGSVTLDLERATVTVPAEAPIDAIVHPLIAHAGLALAHAEGDDAIHASVLLGRSGAWLVVGAKETGKSTLTAEAAIAGVAVLADDVAIMRAGSVLAGPRCVDLRHPPRTPAPTVRHASRWRLTLPPAPASAPLRGIVFPVWGDRLATSRLPAQELVRRVLVLREGDRYPHDPRTVLDLAALPAHELRRPRDIGRLGASVRLLRELIGA